MVYGSYANKGKRRKFLWKKIKHQIDLKKILYKAYQGEEKNTVDEISYYKQIVLQSEKSPIMYGLQDIYPVNIKEPEKFYGNRILLYQNGTPIAMIDENSNIKFSSE